jgi:hypothetical protein
VADSTRHPNPDPATDGLTEEGHPGLRCLLLAGVAGAASFGVWLTLPNGIYPGEPEPTDSNAAWLVLALSIAGFGLFIAGLRGWRRAPRESRRVGDYWLPLGMALGGWFAGLLAVGYTFS